MVKNEKGIGLIEVLIALAILGLVAAAFLSGLATASKAVFIADERTTAESLVRSQMEYVKGQGYQKVEPGDVAVYLTIADIPDGYTIWSLNRNNVLVQDVIGVPWYFPTDQPLPNPGYAVEDDAGLQMIRLVIKHHGKEVMTLEGVKVNR